MTAPTLTSLGRRRLGRLSRYLRRPEVREHWCFEAILHHEGPDHHERPDVRNCGSAGCAWGHAPAVFPTLLEWDVVILDVAYRNGRDAFWSDFFELPESAANWIFAADAELWSIEPSRVTPENVANRIDALLAGDPDWRSVT